MEAQQRSWLGSLGATFVKMSSPLTLDKPANVDYLNILLKRELHNCVIDESKASSGENSSLFSIFPKLHIKRATICNLHTTSDSGPVPLYVKGRWNIGHFLYPDDEAEEPPPHPPSSEPGPTEDATSDETALDEKIAAAWAADPNTSPPHSDSETDASDDATSDGTTSDDTDDRIKDPDYSPSSSSISDASDHPSHSSTTAVPPKKSISPERQFARFLNALILALRSHMKVPGCSYPSIKGSRTFSAAFSTSPIFHALGPRKPDLIVVESKEEPLLDDISWEDPKLIMELTEEEYTPTSRIALTMHSKAYLMLRSQPWRRFVLGFSVAHDLMRLHYYDRCGAIISRPLNIHQDPYGFVRAIAAAAFADRSYIGFDPTIQIYPPRSVGSPKNSPTRADDIRHVPLPPGLPTEPIGWVLGPDGEKYDILKLVWASQGLVGRGTACYCVRDTKTGEIFALKDSWVDNSQLEHESGVLERLRGIRGIPVKIKAWNVQFKGKADSTIRIRLVYKQRLTANVKMAIGSGRTHRRILMSPFATSIVNFGSVEEFVSAICDVVRAHAKSLKRGVLHRDISINNLMLYWSFLMSIPFVEDEDEESENVTSSRDSVEMTYESHLRKGLLVDFDYAMLTDGKTFTFKGTGTLPFVSYRILEIIRRNASDESGRQEKQIVDHRPEDDLESLFYVVVWICMLYDGPNNTLRTDVNFTQTPLFRWAEHDFARGDFAICSLSKFQLMTSSDSTVLTDHITPYFKCLVPSLLEWRNRIGETFDKADHVAPPLHADVLAILNKALKDIRNGNTTRTFDVNTTIPPTGDVNCYSRAAHNTPIIDSFDTGSTIPQVQDTVCRTQAAQKRAKPPIPPSDRQLRSRNAGFSLSETLVKRVPAKKHGAQGGGKSSTPKRFGV